MKHVIPLWPLEGSALANTTNTPASMLLDIQHLLPSRIHSSPHLVARVFKANASEPLPGSDKQKLATVSVDKRERYFSFCAAVPYVLNAVISSVFWISISTATAGSTLAISSTAMQACVKLIPEPPYSGGASMPISPCSKSAATTSGSMTPASSIACALGASTSCANLATWSRIISSSSERLVDASRRAWEAQVRRGSSAVNDDCAGAGHIDVWNCPIHLGRAAAHTLPWWIRPARRSCDMAIATVCGMQHSTQSSQAQQL
mmetsp:Transcript_118034/g.220570  ORF Transcript_118034/g.220570 Transcript_118034/m.220570 type:complete len:261 (+) Transcript_118034:756-1538(+)